MNKLESVKVKFEINGEEKEFTFFEDYLNYRPEESVIDESGETTYERPERYYLIPNIVRFELMEAIRELTGDTRDDFSKALEEESRD